MIVAFAEPQDSPSFLSSPHAAGSKVSHSEFLEGVSWRVDQASVTSRPQKQLKRPKLHRPRDKFYSFFVSISEFELNEIDNEAATARRSDSDEDLPSADTARTGLESRLGWLRLDLLSRETSEYPSYVLHTSEGQPEPKEGRQLEESRTPRRQTIPARTASSRKLSLTN